MTMPRWFGFNPPFIGGQQQIMSRQEDLRLIKNDVIQLLMTVPGERIHRPTFGSPLRQTVFDPNDDQSSDNLISSIKAILQEEEPRLTNIAVYATRNADAYQLDVTVTAVLTSDPNVLFELELGLAFQTQTAGRQEIVISRNS